MLGLLNRGREKAGIWHGSIHVAAVLDSSESAILAASETPADSEYGSEVTVDTVTNEATVLSKSWPLGDDDSDEDNALISALEAVLEDQDEDDSSAASSLAQAPQIEILLFPEDFEDKTRLSKKVQDATKANGGEISEGSLVLFDAHGVEIVNPEVVGSLGQDRFPVTLKFKLEQAEPLEPLKQQFIRQPAVQTLDIKPFPSQRSGSLSVIDAPRIIGNCTMLVAVTSTSVPSTPSRRREKKAAPMVSPDAVARAGPAKYPSWHPYYKSAGKKPDKHTEANRDTVVDVPEAGSQKAGLPLHELGCPDSFEMESSCDSEENIDETMTDISEDTVSFAGQSPVPDVSSGLSCGGSAVAMEDVVQDPEGRELHDVDDAPRVTMGAWTLPSCEATAALTRRRKQFALHILRGKRRGPIGRRPAAVVHIVKPVPVRHRHKTDSQTKYSARRRDHGAEELDDSDEDDDWGASDYSDCAAVRQRYLVGLPCAERLSLAKQIERQFMI